MHRDVTFVHHHVGLARVLACMALVLVGVLSPPAPSPRAEAPALLLQSPGSAGLPDLPNGTPPLARMLNPDGTLDLTTGYQGALDPRGWRLASAPGEAPRFAPLTAPGDELWSDEFTLNGLSGGSPTDVHAIAVSGSSVYIGGDFSLPGNHIVRWDGSRWRALGSGVSGSVNAIAIMGSHVYVGGSFSLAGGIAVNNVAFWDGSSWHALTTGTSPGEVNALAADAVHSDVYVGGYFNSAGGVTSHSIARWHEEEGAWYGLGGGVDHVVSSLVWAGSFLYVGGNFTEAYNPSTATVPANHIAWWGGSSWMQVRQGLTYAVQSLAFDAASGKLYAATGTVGFYVFQVHSCIPASADWQQLGPDFGQWVHAVAVDASGTLYAGGQFTSAGNYLASWDGATWSEVGGGVDSYVGALAMSGTDLYVGGYLTHAGGLEVNHIARYDTAGSAWSAFVGGGADNTVRAAATDAGGGLPGVFIGGDFGGVGGLGANNIARWDGAHWSALGSGTSGTVLALAPGSACDLYVGGQFATAGGIPAYGIARRFLLCERVYLPLALRN